MKRMRFLQWINRWLFKTKEGVKPSKTAMFLYHVLFPFNFFYEKQSGIKYDVYSDVYTIRGVEITGGVFDALKTGKNEVLFITGTNELTRIKAITMDSWLDGYLKSLQNEK